MPEAIDNHVAEFEQHRSRLFGLAYRMIGLRADAEDVVQEAYLRWHSADRDTINNAEAWLVTVATRISIDRLRSMQSDRVSYLGEWLPEPIVEPDNSRPDRSLEIRDDISIAFLYVLQRLGPEERAAFLLHDVLDSDYESIAETLGKSESAVRQMVHRARERVKTDRKRHEVSESQHRALVSRFISAVQSADEQALMSLFADNATWVADGGGKAAATINVLTGNNILTKFLIGIRSKIPPDLTVEFATVNGTTGLLMRIPGRIFSAYSIETDGEHIVAVYAVVNPDKLVHIS